MRAVVTGATSGIGRSFATQLAADGYDLVLTGRREDLLAEVSSRLRAQHGVAVSTITGDLATAAVEQALMESIRSQQVNCLVNNAGSGLSSDFADANPETIERLRNLLVGLPDRAIHAALPGMIKAGRGTIINVGSLAGRVAVPGSSIYVASKIYVERMSETLALELREKRVVVQALIPGYVRTDFHREVPDYQAKQRSSGVIRWLEADDVVSLSLQVARRAARRLEGERPPVPRHRDVVVIPGVMNRLLSGFSRLVPRRVVYAAAVNRKKLE